MKTGVQVPFIPDATHRVLCTTEGCGFKADAAGATPQAAVRLVAHDAAHALVAVPVDYAQHPLYAHTLSVREDARRADEVKARERTRRERRR